jgi:hypothetical protein
MLPNQLLAFKSVIDRHIAAIARLIAAMKTAWWQCGVKLTGHLKHKSCVVLTLGVI